MVYISWNTENHTRNSNNILDLFFLVLLSREVYDNVNLAGKSTYQFLWLLYRQSEATSMEIYIDYRWYFEKTCVRMDFSEQYCVQWETWNVKMGWEDLWTIVWLSRIYQSDIVLEINDNVCISHLYLNNNYSETWINRNHV